MKHAIALVACLAVLNVNAAPTSGFFDSLTSFVRRTLGDTYITFSDSLVQTQKATYAQYKGTNVTDEAAFLEMQKHILKMYSGIKTPGNITGFVINGTYGDCIPLWEQPTVHLLGLKVLDTPPSGANTTDNSTFSDSSKGAPSILSLNLTDPYGNLISCPDDTAPMTRLTLDTLTRFSNLTAFFYKPHDAIDGKGILTKRDSPHTYARTIDTLTNFGGNSWLNLWNPKARFSLSQHWYVVNTPHQTVEGGWVVGHINDDRARLFIYWTADDYVDTGCWDRSCDGFVQINGNWYIGGPWNHYSTYGGTQWGFTLQWKLYKGNWWLFLKGPGDYEAVGYYPSSIFSNGPITKHADFAKWGGEVAADGDGNFGEMGSGHFSAEGFGKAAFQEEIFTIPRDEDGGYGDWASLASLHVSNKACYDIKTTPNGGGSWGSYFYFGGPGGKGCA